jgi:hypothetical protein
MILTSATNTHGEAGEGDLTSSDPGAQPGGGGQGAIVDGNQTFPWGNGIPSAITMPVAYHVHVFLGLYVNGQEIAIPDGIGMVNPYPDSNSSNPCTGGQDNFTCYADLFYYTHTHDPSGAIHLEAPSPNCNNPPAFSCTMSVFTLGNVFDVWGISISSSNFGPFNGPVTIYSSPLKYTECQAGAPACYTPSNTYSLYTGDPRAIPLFSHVAIWILVGSGNPTGSSLPNVQWELAH